MAAESTSCANCGAFSQASEIKLRSCGTCRSVHYCNKTCQAVHWKQGGHKQECKTLALISFFKAQGNSTCLYDGLIRTTKWWSDPGKPPLSELKNPGLPPTIGALYKLELRSELFNDRLCVVLGEAPSNRVAVLCRSDIESATQGTMEQPIAVLSKSLLPHGFIHADKDWHGYSFAKGYPTLYESAFLRTPRILTSLREMGLNVEAMRLIPVVPTEGTSTAWCYGNVGRFCNAQRNCRPVFGYSLLPGLSCGCLNIEPHAVIRRPSGVFDDITSDIDSLAAKFFIPDQDISFEEFWWLGHARIIRLKSLNRRVLPLNISPYVNSRGISALMCCNPPRCHCSTETPESNKCILPRDVALGVIAWARQTGVDFSSILYQPGSSIPMPPNVVLDALLDPKWEH